MVIRKRRPDPQGWAAGRDRHDALSVLRGVGYGGLRPSLPPRRRLHGFRGRRSLLSRESHPAGGPRPSGAPVRPHRRGRRRRIGPSVATPPVHGKGADGRTGCPGGGLLSPPPRRHPPRRPWRSAPGDSYRRRLRLCRRRCRPGGLRSARPGSHRPGRLRPPPLHGRVDPRLEIRIGDGFDYVAGGADPEAFDLLVLDLTDPVGYARPLYTAEFFRACRERLTAGGALCLHTASPIFQPRRLVELCDRLAAAFPVVTPYFVTVPLYGGLWGMACAAPVLDIARLAAAEVDRRIAARGLAPLAYYNGASHRAMLARPNFVRQLLG